MSSVVFILGAGASKQCGAPLMANFLDVASDLLRTNRVEEKRQQFEQVFSAIGALQAVHSKAQLDLNNIESIFTALELGRIIQRVPGVLTEMIPTTIASLKDLIVKTLEVTIPFPLKGTDIGVPKPYGAFAELLRYLRGEASPTQSVSAISFNYDIAADMALFRAGLGPDYVIDRPPNCHNPVPLLKLHGSLNWATQKEDELIRPLHLLSYFQTYRIVLPRDGEVFLGVGSQLSEYFPKCVGIDVAPEPVIVPPSWNKADYHNALSDIWAAAAKHLSEAEYIFVIGYSLPETDSFFRHLYALGSVGKSALRRFVVFNPDSTGETDRRFRALLGPGATARYEYKARTFEESLADIKAMFPKRK
ncbi:MAG TPA: hypothetical protein PLO14_07990 [Accumulibacter sp.]|nr:hypothetical protein [Accumulibacter sp.]